MALSQADSGVNRKGKGGVTIMVGSLQRDAFIEVIHEAARTDDRIISHLEVDLRLLSPRFEDGEFVFRYPTSEVFKPGGPDDLTSRCLRIEIQHSISGVLRHPPLPRCT